MKNKKANMAKIAELITEAQEDYKHAQQVIALQIKAGTRILLSRKDIVAEVLIIGVIHDTQGTRVALLNLDMNEYLFRHMPFRQEVVDFISFIRDLEVEGFKAKIFIPREGLFSEYSF